MLGIPLLRTQAAVARIALACALSWGAGLPARAGELPDGEARAVLEALEGPSARAARAAIDRAIAAGDTRFTAPLIELLRAAEVGIAAPGTGPQSARALETLSGQDFGTVWPDWVRWYAGTELVAPPGFTGFKGRLLGRIDPAFEGLLRDTHPSRIRAEEIVWGGVAFDGIPGLDQPAAIPADQAGYLSDDEPVFGVALGGEARAYPLRILDWHEMANDALGGVPFALAYCTLCGAGIVYDTRNDDGAPHVFGSSGLLMRSNKLMFDRATQTLWNHVTGRPVLGPLADRDLRLPVLPSVTTTWGAWKKRHPRTTVLSLETGHDRPYEPGAAYAGYFASPETMFPVRGERTELPAKARIYGIEHEGLARAWPLDALLEAGILNDRIGDLDVVLVVGTPRIEVDGESVRSGPARYTSGAAVRAYARGPRTLGPGPEPDRWKASDGRTFLEREDRLIAPDGTELARVPGVLGYWFGWSAFHPRTSVYGHEGDEAKASTTAGP